MYQAGGYRTYTTYLRINSRDLLKEFTAGIQVGTAPSTPTGRNSCVCLRMNSRDHFRNSHTARGLGGSFFMYLRVRVISHVSCQRRGGNGERSRKRKRSGENG